jgi:hypothetical protein
MRKTKRDVGYCSPRFKSGWSATARRPRRSPAGEEDRRSWRASLGCAAGFLAPRPAAHADEEGCAGANRPEEVVARANCGGGAGAATTAAVQIRAATGGAGARCAGGNGYGLGRPGGATDKKREGPAASACGSIGQRNSALPGVVAA